MEPGESGFALLVTVGLVGEAGRPPKTPRLAGAAAAFFGEDLPEPENIVISAGETLTRETCCSDAGGMKAEAIPRASVMASIFICQGRKRPR